MNYRTKLGRSRVNTLEELIQFAATAPTNAKIRGYFQDYRIVKESWEILFKRIQDSPSYSPLAQSCLSERIAIHIRCGDYISNRRTRGFHGLTSPTYFVENAARICERTGINSVILVSDQPTIARALIGNELERRGIQVSNSESIDALGDIMTLSTSSHIVASNSSFSWWASWIAWMRFSSHIVIPTPWFRKHNDLENYLHVPQWTVAHRELTSSYQ